MEQSADQQGARFGRRIGVEAIAEVLDDLVMEELAAAVPAASAGELLDAAAESAKADELG
jgi:hypothetical protein